MTYEEKYGKFYAVFVISLKPFLKNKTTVLMRNNRKYK